ncbi:hypothetical protein IJG66_01615 [Candidatus Saccharibacteria bacterium]|nr:hypothetical protein [Candidatus Saccharibacteria bacterium]
MEHPILSTRELYEAVYGHHHPSYDGEEYNEGHHDSDYDDDDADCFCD